MPPTFLFNDPKHWRERAQQARAVADAMDDKFSAKIMRQIADQYEALAERADKRTNGKR